MAICDLCGSNRPVYQSCVNPECLNSKDNYLKRFGRAELTGDITANANAVAAPVQVYPHYYKRTPAIGYVDIYWVLQSWAVTNPGVQHAVKKLLCSGNRGAKDRKQDLFEALDSIKRAIELEEP